MGEDITCRKACQLFHKIIFAEQKVIEEAVDSEVDESFYREALNKIEETMAESYAHPDFPAIIQPLVSFNINLVQ